MKYSIIVPVHNAMQFLPNCVDSIISQDFHDYELIISDDHSNDGTKEYLESINSSCVKIVHTKERLSMVKHFEWALQFASGEWVMFLGADDGLQSYFFELAEFLTEKAKAKDLRVIMSSRAYYFWKNSEELYGNVAINYSARKEFKVLDCNAQTRRTLMGLQEYFELPEMYATSMFKMSLLRDVLLLQNGRVFTSVQPDANLGAIAMILEKKYLKSFIPLGSIGTSSTRTSPVLELPENGIVEEGIEYCSLAGHYHIGSSALYFWNALMRTSKFLDRAKFQKLQRKSTKLIIFSGVYAQISRDKPLDTKKKLALFKDMLEKNSINFLLVRLLSVFVGSLYYSDNFIYKVIQKISNSLCLSHSKYVYRQGDDDVDMNDESRLIKREIKSEGLI